MKEFLTLYFSVIFNIFNFLKIASQLSGYGFSQRAYSSLGHQYYRTRLLRENHKFKMTLWLSSTFLKRISCDFLRGKGQWVELTHGCVKKLLTVFFVEPVKIFFVTFFISWFVATCLSHVWGF